MEINTETVSQPKHYTQQPVECIEITEHLNFTLGNAVKYLWRYLEKENSAQDLCKAIWYLERQASSKSLMPVISREQYVELLQKLDECNFTCMQQHAIKSVVTYAYTAGMDEYVLIDAIQSVKDGWSWVS